MVIDRIETYIFYDRAGSWRSQQDCDNQSRIAWGILNIGLHLFFMVRITAFPLHFLSLFICFKCKNT